MYVLYNNRDGKMNNERIILNERSMFWKEGDIYYQWKENVFIEI